MSAENRKESEVVNVRLENIKLKNKLKKKEHQLKSKVSTVYCKYFDLELNSSLFMLFENTSFWEHLGPVVQSIISLRSSLRGQLVKCFTT